MMDEKSKEFMSGSLHRPATICSSTDVEASRGLDLQDLWMPARTEWFIMASLSFMSLMVSLDATILVTVLPVLTESLQGSSVDAFWASTSYLLTSAIFQPVIASFSGSFGQQQLLITSLVCFAVGTILCATAQDFTVMLMGRSVQGIGGGGIITMTQVLFCKIVPLSHRPKYFSMVLIAWSVGSITGPVVGGVLAEKASWRWCFYINIPLCCIGLFAAVIWVRVTAVEKLTIAQKLKRTDWVGAVLFVGSTTSLLIGLSWGGVQHPWTSAATLAPAAAGVSGLVLFVMWQRYGTAQRMLLPSSVFRDWSLIAAFYCALVNGLILFTALYYLPFYRMSVHGSTPVRAGIELFPAVCLLVVGAVVTAVLISRRRTFRYAIWVGWTVAAMSCGMFTLFDSHTSLTVFAVALAIFGVGNGIVLTSVNAGIQALSQEDDCAMAGSMYGFMRSLGMPLGVALSGTIHQNAMSGRLSELGLPSTLARGSQGMVSMLKTMADADPRKMEIVASYVGGFRPVFLMMAAVSASAFVASLVIRNPARIHARPGMTNV